MPLSLTVCAMMRLPLLLAAVTIASLVMVPTWASASEGMTSCITMHDDLPIRTRVSMCRCLAAKAASLRGWVEWIFVTKAVRETSDLNVCRSAALGESPTLPPVQERKEDIELSSAGSDATGALKSPVHWLIPRPRDRVRQWPSNVTSP